MAAALDPRKRPPPKPAGASGPPRAQSGDADQAARERRGELDRVYEDEGMGGQEGEPSRNAQIVGKGMELGGKATKAAGSVTKAAGTATQAVGKTTQAVGAVGQAAGAATELAGKGVQAVGSGVSAVGKALTATKVGAIVGAPLMALGGAAKGAGKGVEGAGKGVKEAGKGVRKAGEKVDQAGKKTREAGENVKQKGENLKQTGQAVQQMTKEDTGESLPEPGRMPGEEFDEDEEAARRRLPTWAKSAQAERDLRAVGRGGSEPGVAGKARTAGKAAKKTAKAGMRMAGKTMQVAGKTVQLTGRGITYAGKGVSAASTGVSSAGRALSATGVGAIVGVPLIGVGIAGKGVGKGAEYGGRGVTGIGKGISGAGKRLNKAGQQKTGAGAPSDAAFLFGRSQVAGLLCLFLLYAMGLMTWGHSLYAILIIYYVGAFSKFMRHWIPPVGTLWDPFARASVLLGKPAKPSIGPRIAETLFLMFAIVCVAAFDTFFIGAIVLTLEAIDQFCGTPVIGWTCDIIGQISKFFGV